MIVAASWPEVGPDGVLASQGRVLGRRVASLEPAGSLNSNLVFMVSCAAAIVVQAESRILSQHQPMFPQISHIICLIPLMAFCNSLAEDLPRYQCNRVCLFSSDSECCRAETWENLLIATIQSQQWACKSERWTGCQGIWRETRAHKNMLISLDSLQIQPSERSPRPRKKKKNRIWFNK